MAAKLENKMVALKGGVEGNLWENCWKIAIKNIGKVNEIYIYIYMKREPSAKFRIDSIDIDLKSGI